MLKSSKFLPNVSLGLKDIIGTTSQSSEYIVLSKGLGARFKPTLGIGWGFLGTSNVIGKMAIEYL